MVRDRLQEFRQQAYRQPEPISAQALQQQQYSSHNFGGGDPFLDHVDQMRESVEQIELRVRQLLNVQEAVLGQTVVRPEDKEQLDRLIEEIRHQSGTLRPKLRQLERDLQGSGSAGDAQRRMRRNHSDQLRRRLTEVLELFSSAQEDYRQRVNRRVRRQLELAGEHLSAAEVDQLLEDRSEEIFFRRLSPGSYAAQLALQDASSRHSELLRLERSIVELNDCFQDMAHLVHAQGALVDNIETNVQSAADYIGQARVQVHHAVQYRKSAERMKCVIVLVVVVLLLVLSLVLIILLTKFIPFGSH